MFICSEINSLLIKLISLVVDFTKSVIVEGAGQDFKGNDVRYYTGIDEVVVTFLCVAKS
jgi:hypothetical protein